MCAPTAPSGGGGGFGTFTRADGSRTDIPQEAAAGAYAAPTPIDPAIIQARQNIIMSAQRGASSATGGSSPTGA